MLSPDEIEKLVPAEEEKLRSPIPTRAISSDEFFPEKQTEKQKALSHDAVSLAKSHYDQFCDGRTNLRYGYMQT